MPRLLAKAEGDRNHSPLVVPRDCDLTVSVADLAEALLTEDRPSPEIAERELHELRRRTRATEAIFWEIANGSARRVLYSGRRLDALDAIVPLADGGVAIERLRRTGTVVCRFGEVSGVEELVPDGAQSFVVAAAISRQVICGALALDWANTMPRFDASTLRHLRIAAALLARATIGASFARKDPDTDTILGSLANPVAVVDRNGTIVRVNVAWTEFEWQGAGSSGIIGPGVNVLEACRTAAANGCPEASETLSGIEAVCHGSSESFETTYPCHSASEERWCTLTVTPLRYQEGAVIAQSQFNRDRLMDLARRTSEELFHRLADSLSLPLWILAPDGRLLFGNERWRHAAGIATGNSLKPFEWAKAFHPDDRRRIVSAFRSAVTRGDSFQVELRVNAADGTYRWSACMGAPHRARDGRLESVIVFCCDASAKRHAESALKEIAAKLVAAQERERSRIARELHDDLGQQVTLLASKLDVAARSEGSPHQLQAGLAEARKGLQELASSVHNLSHELHPAKLKLLGLGPTLEALCRNISAESGVPITLNRGGIPPFVSEDSAVCLFRVAQEALHNAVKHSGARNIRLAVNWEPAQLILRISDDGAGFDPLASQSAGLGLLTMRERVELMGGRLTIETRQAHGTTIEATLPLADHTGTAERDRQPDERRADRAWSDVDDSDSAA